MLWMPQWPSQLTKPQAIAQTADGITCACVFRRRLLSVSLSTLVQEKRRWLSDHAVAYLNVDTVLQGNYTFDMSATPSLKAAGIRATSRVGTAATVFTHTNKFLRSVICFVDIRYFYNCKISLSLWILIYTHTHTHIYIYIYIYIRWVFLDSK